MITVYSLTKTPIPICIAKLLHKIMQKNNKTRVLVVCGTDEESTEWDRSFWTFHPEIFLPHGRTEDLWPEKQPILLSCNAEKPQNKATIVIFSDINKVRDWAFFDQYVWVTHTRPDSLQQALPVGVNRRGFCEEGNQWKDLQL